LAELKGADENDPLPPGELRVKAGRNLHGRYWEFSTRHPEVAQFLTDQFFPKSSPDANDGGAFAGAPSWVSSHVGRIDLTALRDGSPEEVVQQLRGVIPATED
jgi:hypothetical protein